MQITQFCIQKILRNTLNKKYGCRIQDQYTKTTVFLYNHNEHTKNEIYNSIKKNKNLGINLTKDGQKLILKKL